MNKYDAQLQQDTGVIVGQICNVNVVAPEGGFDDAKIYQLVYDDTDKVFNLVEHVDNIGGVPVELPASPVTSTAYNLVYDATDPEAPKFVMTAVAP